MTRPLVLVPALAYGLARYREGALGKTLLVAWHGATPLLAIAAGLSTTTDRERFAVLGRYLLRRDRADGYWLVTRADLGGEPHLLAEHARTSERQVSGLPIDSAGGVWGGADPVALAPGPLIGDLLDGGGSLPAIMRRELDRLAERCAIAPPAHRYGDQGWVSNSGCN